MEVGVGVDIKLENVKTIMKGKERKLKHNKKCGCAMQTNQKEMLNKQINNVNDKELIC